MRPLLFSLFAAALLTVASWTGGPASAQSAPANTLTPQEITDGWILLFDGDTPFGWTTRGGAKWEVREGTLSSIPGAEPGFLSTTTEFANFRLKVDFWADGQVNSGVFLRCPAEGPINQDNAYEVNIFDPHERWPTGSINGIARTSVPRPQTTGRWNTFEILAQGDRLHVRLNGQETVDARDGKWARGCVALQTNGPGTVRFRNVKLQPLGLTSIFDGKSLAGWKEIPGRKSVYTVTPEGWLNVKNGNGDLQSEGEWADFVFQLDIISNGTHLNSGVFFRGEKGQFWSGYESQIRNEWMGDDRTKPVDFGTGGIYNRQPARRVVSSDREWFTKTIIAHGRHMAVWVNGIQVSDYTDDRPANRNARQGYRAEKGCLSLQGHDPTTDLSFRNLRIAELPPGRM